MLAQGCSDNPESALPAQDVTLKQGETLVVIKRQEESCTLEVQASRADNNAIVATEKMLMPSESAFVLRLNDIAGVDAITLWATCRDERSRIVEMGKTVIAVPSSASSIHFNTRRLPVSGDWYRMTSPETTWAQNAIWAYSDNKAVITGNKGKLRIWNGFGWHEKVSANLECINFTDVTGTEVPSQAFISAKYSDPKSTLCSEKLIFSLDFADNQLFAKYNHKPTGQILLSSGFHPVSSAKLIYTSDTNWNGNPGQSFASDPGWNLSDSFSLPVEDGSVYYAGPSDGRTLSIAVNPFMLKQGSQKEPYPYWILTGHSDQQWFWKFSKVVSRPVRVKIDSAMPASLRKIDRMVAGKIVGSRSLASEATWIIGEGLPQEASIPVAIALPTAVAYATQDPASPIKPETLATHPLNCGKIYTPASDMNTAYVLCSQGMLLNWLLTCRASADGTSVTCQSEKIDLFDRSANEKLVGIDGKGSNQLWLIGDQGGIWLYQK